MTEQKLIESQINLTVEYFDLKFDKIQLSEIVKYEHDYYLKDDNLKGICFYGRKISLNEYESLNNELKVKGLKLLVSFDTFTKRWNNFSFPKFQNKDLLIDIDKQCYSLINLTNNTNLSKYLYSYDEDRKILTETLQKWADKFDLEILWNDYFDLVVKFSSADNYKEEISNDIDNWLYYKLANELTVEEKMTERFRNFPIVSLYLK